MKLRFKFTLTYSVDGDIIEASFHCQSLTAFVLSFDKFQRSHIDFFIDNLLEVKQELEEAY